MVVPVKGQLPSTVGITVFTASFDSSGGCPFLFIKEATLVGGKARECHIDKEMISLVTNLQQPLITKFKVIGGC
jgi:hypothetical protein